MEEHDAAGLFVNCTGIIGAEAFEKLRLPRDPILSSLQTITFYSPSGRSFRYNPGKPLAFVVSRVRFDQALVQLAAHEGAHFRYGYHARLIRVDQDAVEIRTREDDPEPIRAKTAVIATGFGSNLAAQVGLIGPTQIVYGAQAEVEMDNLRDVEIYLGKKIAPNAFAWIVPLTEKKARIGLTVAKEAPVYFQHFLKNPAIAGRLHTKNPTMLLSPIPVCPMEPSSTDRVLVVGEAAGQVKTTTHGGIYYGMLCAVLAAQTLQDAFEKNNVEASFLRRYDRRWLKIIGPELKTGGNLRQLFANLSDAQIDAMVELGARDDIIGVVRRLAHFDWHKKLIQSSLELPALQKVTRA